MGLTDPQLVSVNSRLFELAERARPYILAGQLNEAEVSTKAAVSIGADVPTARDFVLQKLTEALLVLNDEGILGQSNKKSSVIDEVSSRKSLLDISQILNAVCAEAQKFSSKSSKGAESF